VHPKQGRGLGNADESLRALRAVSSCVRHCALLLEGQMEVLVGRV